MKFQFGETKKAHEISIRGAVLDEKSHEISNREAVLDEKAHEISIRGAVLDEKSLMKFLFGNILFLNGHIS